MKTRTDLAALVLVGLVIVAMTLLALEHLSAPEIFSTVLLVTLGGGLGIALPTVRDTSSGTTPAVVDEPAPVIPAPAPVPAAETVAPVATHAP